MERIAKPDHSTLRVLVVASAAGALTVLLAIVLLNLPSGLHLLAAVAAPDSAFTAYVFKGPGVAGACIETVFVASAKTPEQDAPAPGNLAYTGSCGGLQQTDGIHGVAWAGPRTLTLSFDPGLATGRAPAELHGTTDGGKVRITYKTR